MAERYRDLVGPQGVDLNARMTPSGSPEAANELASTFANFSRQTHAVGSFFREQAGQREGAEAGQSGEPEFRRGVRALTAYGRAYNSAALRSYAIRSEQDLAVQAARIEAEAGTDPEVFAKSMDAIRKATIEEAPPEARAILEEVYANRTAQGLARINVKLAEDLRKEDQILVEDEVERLTSEIADLMVTDATGEELSLKETQLEMLIQSAERDSTLTKGQAGALRRGAAKRVRHESVLEQFRGELDAADGDPIGFIEDLKELNRVSEDLTPQEEQQLVNALFQEMNERNRLTNLRQSVAEDELAAIRERAERDATVGVLRGEISIADIADRVDSGGLDPAIGRTLSNMVASGDVDIESDPEALFNVQTQLAFYSPEDIRELPNISFEDKARLYEDRIALDQNWRTSQAAKEAYARIDRELEILPNTSPRDLPDHVLKARGKALTLMYARIDALPTEERTDAAIMEIGDEVVNTIIKENKHVTLQRLQEQLNRKLQEHPEEMDEDYLTRWENSVERLEQKIATLQSELGGNR